MNDEKYLEKLLVNWEETYKKGQLTFWIMLSLKEQSLFQEEIKERIDQLTDGAMTCKDQSLYRALRKFYEVELVDYEMRPGHKGPERKYYFLTPLGKVLLKRFIDRNIKLFYNEKIVQLINHQTANPL